MSCPESKNIGHALWAIRKTLFWFRRHVSGLDWERDLSFRLRLISFFFKIFMVTGGWFSNTTEILKDKKWTVLKNGNLSVYGGLRLATIDNLIFSFGNTSILRFIR